ncbi:MAG TPA: hypothetical protein VHY22_03490 [Chthoniobacteraceae bacterium]|nr:hypothetical protein [Chthoniobacteraceae bacterium]
MAESPTPEVAQLLRLLELQTSARRGKRTGAPRSLQGGAFRYGSLVVIVVFAVGAIGMMEWMVSQLPKPAGQAAAGSQTAMGNANPGGPSAGSSPAGR